ncbi:hypothetical protein T08_7615 [Trichinella sp. T8]|nr:hypothetical protein T08_7615 [Trichinella sp. T8]
MFGKAPIKFSPQTEGINLRPSVDVYLRLVRQDDRTESELTTAGIHGGSVALTVDHLCEKGTGDEHSTQ